MRGHECIAERERRVCDAIAEGHIGVGAEMAMLVHPSERWSLYPITQLSRWSATRPSEDGERTVSGRERTVSGP